LTERLESVETALKERIAKGERQAAWAMEAHHASARLQAQLAAIEGSTAWRVTRPLRQMGASTPWLSRNLRRGLKLAWWTVTLQLPARYRARREALASSAAGRAASNASAQRPSRAPKSQRAPKASEITIDSSPTPTVSVIISTYGQLNVT